MINFFGQDINKWFDEWKFFRPVFFTGVLNDELGYGESELVDDRIKKNNKHFMNELHRKVFKKSKKKITSLVVIEKGNGRKHCHIVLDTPEHLSITQFQHMITQSWKKTKNGVSVQFSYVYDLENLKSYLAKEIYPKCEVLGVDVRTSYNQPSSS